MQKENRVEQLLEEIKFTWSHQEDYECRRPLKIYWSIQSKIYKLTQLKLIPMGNNQRIRQKFFYKDEIDVWLMGEPNISDDFLEAEFSKQLFKNKKT